MGVFQLPLTDTTSKDILIPKEMVAVMSFLC